MHSHPFPFYSIGHFINQPNNPTEFEVTRFEEMEELDIEDPHKHTFYEVLWVDEGLSTQVIDYRAFDIHPGTLFFISPGQLHHFEEWQPLRGGSVFFTEAFYSINYHLRDHLFELSFLDNFYAQPYLQPTPDAYAEIRHTIELLIAEKRRRDYSPTIAQSLLHVLLAQIQRCIDTQQSTVLSKKYIVTYKKLKGLIDAYFAENLTANDYADRLSVTQHHLNLIAKQVTGKTTTELIRGRSLLEAKRLLTFTDRTVSEIAADLGYFDASYFAKLFKSETGVSPTVFKNVMSEKYRNL